MRRAGCLCGLVLLAACGSSGKGAPPPKAAEAEHKKDADDMMLVAMDLADDGSKFGPLEIGADWQSYTKVNKAPVRSETHGGRFVDTWVNGVGLAAYENEDADMPEGSVVVKTSWQAEGDQPSNVAGPIFVMAKQAKGSAPDHDDWYYAIHWADPPEKWKAKLGGPIYWRSPSKKADYCWECHENYPRGLGMVPKEQQAW
jgi:hypothetical protein